jgi:CRP-like cAMP-binding protein
VRRLCKGALLDSDPVDYSGIKALLARERVDGEQASPGALLSRMRALFGMTSDIAEAAAKETVAQFLGRTNLFGELDARELKWLSRIVHVRHFDDGEFVYEEGRPGAALFLLRHGHVEITKQIAGAGIASIAVLEPPASFEELAALGSDTVHWTSARAKGTAELLAMGRSDLESLSRHQPGIANKVIIRLAEVTAGRVRLVLESQGMLSGAKLG